MPWLPRSSYLDWPKDATALPVADVRKLYENGFAGAKAPTDAAIAEFRATMAYPDAERAAYAFGIEDSGAGKLTIPFVHVVEMFPGCWPGSQGQGRGDCVSWGTRNAILTTMVCDIVSGQPDQTTGKPEEKPEVSAEGIADGVLSTEAIYWYRRHGGDGWMCPEAATVAVKESGCWVRKDYSDLGLNLTRYSSSTAGKWGSRPPDGAVAAAGKLHLAHQATESNSFETFRDLLYNGYGCSSCGGEGFSDKRNEDGVSERSGSWAHAMAYIGADDRDATKQKYGGPLVLVLNSWAKWNGGGRDIMASSALVPEHKKAAWSQAGIVNSSTGNIQIPEGSFWAKWSHVSRREMIHFSGVNGWPAKAVPWIF